MTVDISDTLAPNSDQLDAIELISGSRTFTVSRVSRGSAEQPVEIHLEEFPRPWRPGKSMRRVLVACWGADASVYVGRKVTLYCDETVRFGSEVVGGTRIRALSHISKRKQIPLLISRGKSAMFTVDPLVEPASQPAQRRSAGGMTTPQRGKLTVAFGRLGIEDQSERLDIASRIAGRELDSANDLTANEAGQIIDALEAAIASDNPLLAIAEATAPADAAGEPELDPAEAT